MKGKTVLYLPQENVDLEDLETVRADKDLVQRLESTVIRWTRQIKEVVNLQDNSMNSDAETATPLDEIKVRTIPPLSCLPCLFNSITL